MYKVWQHLYVKSRDELISIRWQDEYGHLKEPCIWPSSMDVLFWRQVVVRCMSKYIYNVRLMWTNISCNLHANSLRPLNCIQKIPKQLKFLNNLLYVN